MFVRNVVNNFNLVSNFMPSKFSRLFHFRFLLIDINPALVEVLTEVFGFILDYLIRVITFSLVIAFYNCSCVINKEVFF